MIRIFLIVLMVMACCTGLAQAHAQFLRGDPEAGAVIATAPETVVLTFNEPVTPLVARWFFPDGTEVDVETDGKNGDLLISAPADLPQGTHLISWRVVSADGHPIAGTHQLSLGAATPTPQADPQTSAAPAAALARLALTLALVFGVGGAAWAALSGTLPGPAARWAGFATLPAGAALLGAQGLDLAGAGPAALLTPVPWLLALLGPSGLTVALSATAGALAAVSRGRSGLALPAWGLGALSFATSGHAATAAPFPVMAALVFGHALALIFWAGALPALSVALARGAGALTMRHFSNFAVPLVLLLVATGAALAWVQTGGSLASLSATVYGRLLAAKLVLVALLLALAVRNKLVLTPRLDAGPAASRASLSHAIRAEIVLTLVILALASAFRLTPPPRALVTLSESAAFAHLHGRTIMADVMARPGHTGSNTFEIIPTVMDGRTFAPLSITVVLTQDDAGIGPITLNAIGGPDGIWRAGPTSLPVAGDWTIQLDVLVNSFEVEKMRASLPVLR